MAIFWVCPIDGMLPGDNGTDQTKTNNPLPIAPTIGTITTGGTAGSTSYFYQLTALFVAGEGPASAEVSITTGNATLTTGNFNTIPWTAVPGAIGYNLYGRITGGSKTFLLTVAAVTTVNDVGVVAGATTVPSTTSLGFTPNYHCPICGSAVYLMKSATVATNTGVSSGSQHPLDVDANYGAQANSTLAQFGASAYTLANGQIVYPHTFAVNGSGNVTRGAQVSDPEANPFVTTNVVTPPTLNSTKGP